MIHALHDREFKKASNYEEGESNADVIPPSIIRLDPVMKELSEDAKNNAAFATSAASPNLPIGMYFSNRSSFSFNLRC